MVFMPVILPLISLLILTVIWVSSLIVWDGTTSGGCSEWNGELNNG